MRAKSTGVVQQLDARIREYPDKNRWETPGTIYRKYNFEQLQAFNARIAERSPELASRELIDPVHGDMYEITRWGLAYLRGDFDAPHLRRWSVE